MARIWSRIKDVAVIMLDHVPSLKENFIVFWPRTDVFVFELKIGWKCLAEKNQAWLEPKKFREPKKVETFFRCRDEVVRDWQAIAKIVLTRITETLRSEHIDAYTFMNRLGRFYNMTDMTFTAKLAGSKVDSPTEQIFTRTSIQSGGKWWEKATGITRPNNVCLTIFMDGVKLATSDPFVVMKSHHAYETYIRVFIDQLHMEKNNLA